MKTIILFLFSLLLFSSAFAEETLNMPGFDGRLEVPPQDPEIVERYNCYELDEPMADLRDESFEVNLEDDLWLSRNRFKEDLTATIKEVISLGIVDNSATYADIKCTLRLPKEELSKDDVRQSDVNIFSSTPQHLKVWSGYEFLLNDVEIKCKKTAAYGEKGPLPVTLNDLMTIIGFDVVGSKDQTECPKLIKSRIMGMNR